MSKRVSLWATGLCALLLTASCAEPNVGERRAGVIPAPVELTKGQGLFAIGPRTEIGYADESLKGMAAQLSEEIERASGMKLAFASDKESNCKIFLELVDPSMFADLPTPYGTSPTAGDPRAEFYQLSVEKDNVYIKAPALAGMRRGIATLTQLVAQNATPAENGKLYLPLVEVKDAPRFAWRGLSLDVSRCFFTVDEVKQVIDMIARYKMNVLHMHLTDNQGWRLEIKAYPQLTEVGGRIPLNGKPVGFYTQEEFKELIAYAADRQVTIVPEVDLPGHTAAVFAAYPELKNAVTMKLDAAMAGQALNALDIDDPKAMALTEAVVKEVAALTPGAYIHVGGDESVGLPHDKYVRYINKVSEMVKANGKRMAGWQETARADIGEGDLFQHWIMMRDESSEDFASSKEVQKQPEALRKMIKLYADFMKEAGKDPELGISKGAKVILSPSRYVYMDMPYLEPSADSTQTDEQNRLGLQVYAKQTVADMYDWDPMTLNPTVEEPTQKVAGIEAAIWCETVSSFSDLQFLLLPRLAGVAEKGWSRVEQTAWDEYSQRLAAQQPLWEKAGWNYFKSSMVPWQD